MGLRRAHLHSICEWNQMRVVRWSAGCSTNCSRPFWCLVICVRAIRPTALCQACGDGQQGSPKRGSLDIRRGSCNDGFLEDSPRMGSRDIAEDSWIQASPGDWNQGSPQDRPKIVSRDISRGSWNEGSLEDRPKRGSLDISRG